MGVLLVDAAKHFIKDMKALMGDSLMANVKDLNSVEEAYIRVAQKYCEANFAIKVIQRRWMAEKSQDP